MKKSIVLYCFFFISAVALAQPDWNVKAGLNLNNWSGDSQGDIRIGYKAGIGFEHHFTEMWSLQSSLFFTTKGVNNTSSYGDLTGKPDVNQMYIELPVYGAIRFNMTDYTDFVISFGPYVACGVGGKTKADLSVNGFHSSAQKVKTFHGDRLQRFDAGLGFGVATELTRLIIGLEAQLGLVKLMDYLDKPHNLTFSVILGYKFWE